VGKQISIVMVTELMLVELVGVVTKCFSRKLCDVLAGHALHNSTALWHIRTLVRSA